MPDPTPNTPLELDTLLPAIQRALPGVDAAAAFSAVMCALEQRLTRGEATHVFKALPLSVRPLVAACTLHRSEAAPKFDERTFLERVAAHASVPVDQAERVARTVLSIAQTRLSPELFEHVASQLPSDLELLWREAWADAHPPAATGT